MTAKEMRVWMAENGFKNTELGARLGRDADTISKWRTGGVPSPIAPMVRLALWAIEHQTKSAKGSAK